MMTENRKDALESLVLEWNIEVPVDRWWRVKHGIAFNSASHRGTSFIDMYWEYVEDRLYRKAYENSKTKNDDPYVPNTHDFVRRRQYDETMSEEDFDNIDI